MTIGVIGGGVAGLTAAYELSKSGYEVVLVEKGGKLGGKLRSVEVGGTPIEEYYHHVFSDDEEFFELLEELGLKSEVEEVEAPTGFYYEDEIHKLSSPFDLLFYKPLSFSDKLNLAKIVLKIKRISDPSEYSDESVKSWIIENSSEDVYRKFFEPLLRSKFGGDFEEVSASWFIERIKLRSDRGMGGEKLFYIRGGFRRFVERLKERIKGGDGKIFLETEPEDVKVEGGEVSEIIFDSRNVEVDGLISTIPPDELNEVIGRKVLEEREYQGVICLLLGLDKSLCDYYWTNVIKEGVPFGAYIEHTQIQPKSLYGNQVISYLASYPELGSEVWEMSDEEVFEKYFSGLKELFDVEREDVNFWKVFRTERAGIVYKKGISPEIMDCETEIPNLLVGGMFNSYPERSINQSIKLGKKCARLLEDRFGK